MLVFNTTGRGQRKQVSGGATMGSTSATGKKAEVLLLEAGSSQFRFSANFVHDDVLVVSNPHQLLLVEMQSRLSSCEHVLVISQR